MSENFNNISVTFLVPDSAEGTYSGTMSGTGELIKDGRGALTLTGTNSYSNGTLVDRGTLSVSFEQNLGVRGGLELGHSDAATLKVTGTSFNSWSRPIGIDNFNGTFDIESADNNFTISQSIRPIAGSGDSGALTKAGAGTLTLTGDNAGYFGDMNLNDGTLSVGSDRNLLGNAPVNVLNFNGGILRVTGTVFTETSNTINWNGGGFDVADANNNFTISQDLGGGSLIKLGAGMLTLTGTNTYAGATNLNGGTLSVSSDGKLGDPGNALNFNGGILQLTGTAFHTTSRTINWNGGGFDIADAGNVFTVSQALSGAGSLTKLGSGTLILSGANTYSGGTTVLAGTLQGDSTSLQGSMANNAGVVFNQTSDGTYSGAMTGTGSLTKQGSGTLILSGANSYSGGTTVSAGMLQGDSTSLQGNIVNNARVVFDQASDGTYAGVLSGTGILTKSGSGSLVLAGANSYGGGTIVNNGTLSVSSDGNLGDPAGVLFFNGGTLQVTGTSFQTTSRSIIWNGGGFDIANANNNFTVGQDLTGSGNLTKLGAGTLALTGANTYVGATNLNGGALSVSSDNNLGDPANALNFNGGTLQVTGTGFHATSRTINWNGGGFDIADAPNVFTVKQVLARAGGLIKLGSGTLILAGANTYSGGTTVSAGTLQGDSTSLQGDITNNASVVFDQAGNGSYAGAMSGTGSLTKQGIGTLVLAGANTYSGGTNLNGGALSVSSDSYLGDPAGPLNFNGGILQVTGTGFHETSRTINWNGGGFDIADAGNVFTVRQTLTGPGGLAKLGDGTLILSGANTYRGGTTVSAGTLIGDSTSLQGAITNNASLEFDQASDGTYAGVVSGTGSVTKTGTGALTLTGANTYSGGTILSEGRLIVTSDSNLGSASSPLHFNGGALGVSGTGYKGTSRAIDLGSAGGGFDIINAGNVFTLNQVISGNGKLVKLGDGMLVLNGTNTYSGGTQVSGGTLEIGDATHPDASVASSVTIDPGAILRGHGTINGDIDNAGTIAPGGSIGTLHVNGNVSFKNNSFFNVEIDPTQSSRLDVTGSASLGNAGVNITADNGVYSPHTYTILTAKSVGGRFGNLNLLNAVSIPSLGSLAPSLEYFPNHVDLVLSTAAPAPSLGVYDPAGAGTTVATRFVNNVQYLIGGRLNAPLGPTCPVNRFGFWGRGAGMFSSADRSGQAAGYDGTTDGAVFGFDTQFTEHFMGGVSGFTAHSDLNTHQYVQDHSAVDTAGVNVYGAYTPGPWQFKGVVGYSNDTYRAHRTVTAGNSSRQAKSTTHADRVSGLGEVSYTFKSGEFSLQPLAALQLGWLERDPFSEKGPNSDGLNLSVDGRTLYALNTLVGLRTRREFTLNPQLTTQLELRALYAHDFGTLDQTVAAHYSGGPYGSISTSDRPGERNFAIVGASLSLLTAEAVNVYLDYNGQISSGQQSHFVSAGLRFTW